MNAPNARFWVYVNGSFVKITLRPGQQVEHVTGGPTDEGWTRDAQTWLYPDDESAVYRYWADEGQDCDGRHGNYGSSRCELSALKAGYAPDGYGCDLEHPEVVYPAWERVEASRYDQFAELAGY